MQDENDVQKNITDAMLGQKIDLGTQAPLKPKPQAPENEAGMPQPKPIIPSAETLARPIIRTYKSDMEETIQAGHLSSINMAVSENNRLMRKMAPASIETKKSNAGRNVIIISLFLIAGGTIAFLVPYLLVKKQGAPTPVSTSAISDQSVMTTDLEDKINLKDINLNGIDVTLNERVNQSSTALGQVKDFLLTEGTSTSETSITSTQFLALIKANVPDEIARNLLPQYMFGMYNYDGNQEFLILKVSSYDAAFAGMLSWETTLWQDFKNLFGLSDTNNAITQTTSSSSASTTNQSAEASFGIEVKKFQDAEFDNENCRVVKDTSGTIVFLYSIINQNTIVIATSPDTLKEIISRIAQAGTVTQ